MIYLRNDDVLLFQGDSITHGGRVHSTWDMNHVIGHGYQDYVAQTLGLDNIERSPLIVNRGVSGDNIDTIIERAQNDIIDIKPTIMSILVGTNDTSRHILSGVDYATPEYFNRRYRELLDTVLNALPDIKLIICQPFRYIVGEKYSEYGDKVIADIKQRCEITEKIANDYNAVYVRFWDALDAYVDKCPIKNIVWDGVHPTYVGHCIMAKCWLGTVERAYKN